MKTVKIISAVHLLAFLWLLCADQLPAQLPQPTVSSLVDRLIANADLYRATLPSLTADETIVSDVALLGMFKRHAEATATFRAVRKVEGAGLDESRQVLVLNGKHVPPGQKVTLPTTLFGGFGRFQDMFFTTQRRPCFNFVLAPPTANAPLQLDITLSPAASTLTGCEAGLEGLTGIARIDPATGQLTHLERTVPGDIAAKFSHARFASVDSAPAKVGDQTYWLPTLVTGDLVQSKVKGTFIAHYSNYHRFAATSTILPATAPSPTAADINP